MLKFWVVFTLTPFAFARVADRSHPGNSGRRALRKLLLVLLVLPLWAAICRKGDQPHIERWAGNPVNSSYVPDEVLVRFVPGASPQQVGEVLSRVGTVSMEHMCGSMDAAYGELYAVSLPQDVSVPEALRILLELPEVKSAEPDYLTELAHVPNDPKFEKQWALHKINAQEAWDIAKGEGILIAIIDSGIDLEHEDLKDNIDVKKTKGFADPTPQHPHGTQMAGIASAVGDNKIGVIGLAYKSKIMALKVTRGAAANTKLQMEALRYAADNGAHVINMSIEHNPDSETPAYHEAIQYAYKKGVVIVACTGNYNGAKVSCPGRWPETISVGAVDQNDQLAKFSNYGPETDVVAPGVSIGCPAPGNSYSAPSGTSEATPFVTALVALILSVNPKLKQEEVREIIRSTAVDLGPKGKDDKFGYGRIDAAAAVKKAQETIKDKKPEEEPGEKDPKKKEPVVARQPEVDPGEKLMEKAGELEKDRKLLEALEIYKRLEGMGERSRYAAAAAEKVRTLLADGELAAQLKEQQGRKKLESDLAMAESYLQNKIYDKALEFARKVIAAAPDSEQAKKAKDIIRRAEGER